MKLNLGCGDYILPGFINLDKLTGWSYESGLPYENESVEAITISHSLMMVEDEYWPTIFDEIHRVLQPGGIVRITEDSTGDKRSKRYGGYRTAKSLTTPEKVSSYLGSRFDVFNVVFDETKYKDSSLIQSNHGKPPKVFFIEGRKKWQLFLAPHCDDECLFGAYTLIYQRPLVLIPFSSEVRMKESRAAVALLGASVMFIDKLTSLPADIIYAPEICGAHPDHDKMGKEAQRLWSNKVIHYATYHSSTDLQPKGVTKVHSTLKMQELKSLALLKYQSEYYRPHFTLSDMSEYYV